MSLNKLTCPECSTVMRPKAPVARGKKVKCPKCSTVFVAGADEDEIEEVEELEEERPRKKAPPAKKKAPAKAEAKPAAKKGGEDAETYGYLKDEGEDEEEEDNKPKINYGEDDSIKDMRGPAIILLRAPTNWLVFTGLIGAVGWLVFTVLLVIPFAFPIVDEQPPSNVRNPSPEEEKAKAKAKKPDFLLVWEWIDFTEVVKLPAYAFWPSAMGFLLLGFFSGLIGVGGIKLLNLESRTWGIAASIWAMLPISSLGLSWVFAFVFQWLVRQIGIEEESITFACMGVAVLLWLASAGLGIWTLVTANNPVVKAGFEYKAE